jgi:hypothetical protein
MAITANVLGEAVQLTGNPVWVECSGGSKPAGSSNYNILLKVISEDGKLDGAPFTDAIAPDSWGKAMFNISGRVDQPVEADFEYPVASAIVSYPTQAFNVKVQPGESWMDEEGVTQESWGSESDVYQFLKGGANPRQVAMWEADGSSFYDTYIAVGRFLSARPQGDGVHPEQPVKLWFMPVSGASATLKVKGVYSDDSDDTYSEAFTLDTDNLYEFNCNPYHLGLAQQPTGKRMKFFDVWIESGGSTISDSRRFNYNWRPCERPFWLFFANSFGGVDDVFLAGKASEGITMGGNSAYQPRKRNDAVTERTIKPVGRKGQNTWSINTGIKSSTEMLFLRDLLVSEQVWLLYPNLSVTSYQVIPVNVTNSELTLVNRENDMYDMELELKEAHESRFTFDNRLY